MKSISRVALSQSATSNLKQLSAKTQLTPNIVARFAMLISFEQESAPAEDTGKPDLIINQSSLFGDIEPFLLTAFSGRARGIPENHRAKALAAHIARGAAYLNLRVSSIVDLVRLCAQ